MHYRRLGKSGIKVSEIALGSWVTFGNQIDKATAKELIHAAYDRGVNFFDNADVYADGQAEIVMGEAIEDIRRTELVISSKVFWPTMPGPNGGGLSRKHIIESINASLRRLKTDYIDLYFCHRYDPDTPIEEVVRSMNMLIQQGKILYWGTSEWTSSQIMQAHGTAKQLNLIPPTMEQPQYSMFHRKRLEQDVAPVCKELGIGLTTWSPLYYGILTGKYSQGIPEGSRATLETMNWMQDKLTGDRLEVVDQLSSLADELGFSLAQLAIAWLLRRKEISSVITGASKLAHIEDNLGASEHVKALSEELLERIEQIIGELPEDID